MRMHSQDKVGGALHPDISRPTVSGRRATAGGFGVNPFTRHPQRGSLILVVLCLLAVLGIALASFLAIGNQSMKLSNRSYRTSMSAQLAEMGLEEALRAFNNNSWSDWSANGTSADWTLSGTTASCTITFPTDKFGQGVTGTVKIRVDNYNTNQLNSTYSSSANYRFGNLVSYGGNWYRSTATSIGKTPTSTSGYWVSEQTTNIASWMNWHSGTAYVAGDMLNTGTAIYRCILAHTAGSADQPTSGTNWATYWVSVPYFSVDSDLHYVNESVLNYYGSWYRYYNGWDGPLPSGTGWNTSWRWTSGITYSYGDVVYHNSPAGWYGYIYSTPTAGNALTNTTYWRSVSSDATIATAAWNWSSTNSYNLNDVVYHSGTSTWYRSIASNNTNNTPSSSSAYWSVAPLLSRTWNSGRQYNANDTVYYNGKWYLSRQNNNYGHTPPTAPTYIDSNWASTDYTSWQWNSSTSYSAGNYRSYGGVWYKCLSGGSNKSPNNSSYWTNSWAQGSGVTTGAPVIYSEGRATLPDSTATIKTQLRATITLSPLFPNALAASSTLTINGGGTIDSYDSSVGTYNVSGNIGYSAVLAATGTTNPAVTVTSTTVNGYVAAPSATTSPFAPMWTSGGSAVLKGTSSGSGVDLTRVSRSPNVPQFDILSVPNYTLLPDYSSGLTIGTPGATTPTYYYTTGSVILDTVGESITIVGPVVLNIQGTLRTRYNTTNKITITSTGSAEIHVSNNLRLDSDSGGIDNQTLDPKKCVIFCTDTAGTENISFTTQPFYGVVYMPYWDLTVDPGVVIYGAISAKNITFSNEANVHYDTSLRYATFTGVDQPWAVTEWRELTDPNERAVLP